MLSDPVLRLFKVVQKNPNLVAVAEHDKAITYMQFYMFCFSISQKIKKRISVVTPKVIIYLGQSVEAYASMFGTLMSGGFYSPIHISGSGYIKGKILQSFEPHIIITSSALSDEIESLIVKSDISCRLIIIDQLLQNILKNQIEVNNNEVDFDINNPKRNRRHRKLAYVIYTSGTTSVPKGVMISRYALAHYTDWAISELKPDGKDKWAQFSNISFDLSVLDIFGSLCSGATLYPVTKKADRLLFGGFIRQNKITIVNIVPSVTDLLIQSKQLTKKNMNFVRLMNYCGEPLMQYQIEAMFKAKPNLRINNAYGPTECTVSCTVLRLTKNNYKKFCAHSVALGNVIPGMDLILERKDDDSGEIVLSGGQVAEGYWQDQEGTNKSFFEKVINGEFVRFYRTGDWARYGKRNLYFVGRKDDQIKVNGYRVELGSVSIQISQLIKMNLHILYRNAQLHCFIERKNKIKLDLKQINRILQSKMTHYELPNILYSINLLPRNKNDKIDKDALTRIAEKYSYSKETMIHL